MNHVFVKLLWAARLSKSLAFSYKWKVDLLSEVERLIVYLCFQMKNL